MAGGSVPGAPRFNGALRGYDRRQVDEHLDRLQRIHRRLLSDLETARDRSTIPIPVRVPDPTPADSVADRRWAIVQAAEMEASAIRKQARDAAAADLEHARRGLAELLRQRDGMRANLARLRGRLDGALSADPARGSPDPEPAADPSRSPVGVPPPTTEPDPPGPGDAIDAADRPMVPAPRRGDSERDAAAPRRPDGSAGRTAMR